MIIAESILHYLIKYWSDFFHVESVKKKERENREMNSSNTEDDNDTIIIIIWERIWKLELASIAENYKLQQ